MNHIRSNGNLAWMMLRLCVEKKIKNGKVYVDSQIMQLKIEIDDALAWKSRLANFSVIL